MKTPGYFSCKCRKILSFLPDNTDATHCTSCGTTARFMSNSKIVHFINPQTMCLGCNSRLNESNKLNQICVLEHVEFPMENKKNV